MAAFFAFAQSTPDKKLVLFVFKLVRQEQTWRSTTNYVRPQKAKPPRAGDRFGISDAVQPKLVVPSYSGKHRVLRESNRSLRRKRRQRRKASR